MLASVVVVMRQKSDQGSCAMTMLNASSDQMLFAPKYAKRRTAANPIINHSTIGATEPSPEKLVDAADSTRSRHRARKHGSASFIKVGSSSAEMLSGV